MQILHLYPKSTECEHLGMRGPEISDLSPPDDSMHTKVYEPLEYNILVLIYNILAN